ncbi:MAG: hypothetical protein U1B83_09870 [Candidatus Cloacimonadaceae bacterium]|nr:hypothetical protein [Candidatus Cloacimonadaceae bacterium]
MKVNLKNMLKAYRGTCDGMVYYYHPQLNRVIGRVHVVPRKSAQNTRLGEVAANLKRLNPSAEFVEDLRIYINLLWSRGEEERGKLSGWYNYYNKLMWALSRAQGIDLRTLTREMIELDDLPCRSVRRAVEAGLLDPVRGFELLESPF